MRYSSSPLEVSSDMSRYPHPTVQDRVQRALAAGRRERRKIERLQKRAGVQA